MKTKGREDYIDCCFQNLNPNDVMMYDQKNSEDTEQGE
jgi:hypothetical protein